MTICSLFTCNQIFREHDYHLVYKYYFGVYPSTLLVRGLSEARGCVSSSRGPSRKVLPSDSAELTCALQFISLAQLAKLTVLQIATMGDIANHDEAKKCLDIANAALQAGNLDKAGRFAEKAMKLFPNDEVRKSAHKCCAFVDGMLLTSFGCWLQVRKLQRIIKSRQGATSSGAGPSSMPNGHHYTASSADMRQRHTASSSGTLQTSLSIVTHVHLNPPKQVLYPDILLQCLHP